MTAHNLAPGSVPVEQATGPATSPTSPGPVETSDIDYDTPAIIPDDLDALSRMDWHMRMVRRQTQNLTELTDLYRAEMDRLSDRLINRTLIIQKAIAWHRAPIESYHRAHPDRKTLELPNGSSKLTVPRTAKVFADAYQPDVVTEWARWAHPEIMRGPNITDVRKVVSIKTCDDGSLAVVDSETGEIVPGVTAQVPNASWSLDVEPGDPFG